LIKFSKPWKNSPASVAESAEQTERSRKRISILVAEDDPVSRELISIRLTKWSYEPVLAKDGLEAMPFDKDKLQARIMVGLRVIGLRNGAGRTGEGTLKPPKMNSKNLRLRIPI
jgi:hypothetical protein